VALKCSVTDLWRCERKAFHTTSKLLESKAEKEIEIATNLLQKIHLLPKKKQALLQHWIREKWHLRQALMKPNTSKIQSPTEEKVKSKPIDEKIQNFVKDNNLGKVRHVSISRHQRGKPLFDTKEKTPTEKLFQSFLRYMGSASKKESFIACKLPEVAFVGRSNVGKSTLINALTHSGLVHTSPRPGTTKTINWFQLGDRLMLVDLPGYGFAFADEKDIDTWQKLTRDYLTNRPTLKRIILLLDARQGVKQTDLEMMKLLNSAHVPFQIALTKCDLLQQKTLSQIGTAVSTGPLRSFRHCIPQLLMVSAKTNAGLGVLRKELFAQLERGGNNSDKKL